MPVEFDPEWEFFTPDPEIEEILEESSSRQLKQRKAETGLSYDILSSFEISSPPITNRHRITTDLRHMICYLYSRGDKLKTISRILNVSYHSIDKVIRQVKVVRNRKGKPLGIGKCKCGKEFSKRKKTSIFCSRFCAGVERVRALKERGTPIWGYTKSYNRRVQKNAAKKRNLRRMWNAGYLVWQIETALNIHTNTLTKWRKEMNLPSRRKERLSCP